MKKYIPIFTAILLALLCSSDAKAQLGKDSIIRKEKRIVIIHHHPDSTILITDSIGRIVEEEIEIDTIIHGPHHPQKVISGLEFGMGYANLLRAEKTTILSAPQGMPELNNGKSLHIGMGVNWGFNLYKEKWRFWTGIRYDILNYRFNDTKTRLTAGASTFSYHLDTAVSASKSKVVVNYIGVPIAIGYQSKPDESEKGFFFRIGVSGGYLVRAHTKIKLEDNNKKIKEFDDFNFNDFTITPFVYIGYNSVAFYARYTTTPLYKSGQGAEANSIQFGVVLM